ARRCSISPGCCLACCCFTLRCVRSCAAPFSPASYGCCWQYWCWAAWQVDARGAPDLQRPAARPPPFCIGYARTPMIYGLLADAVLALHAAFVGFVALGGLAAWLRPRL